LETLKSQTLSEIQKAEKTTLRKYKALKKPNFPESSNVEKPNFVGNAKCGKNELCGKAKRLKSLFVQKIETTTLVLCDCEFCCSRTIYLRNKVLY
jgi:hypothetical protein